MKKLLLLPLLLTAIYTQGTFSGVTYFDYTYDLTEDAANDAGFGLKRVYFTYEQVLSDDVSYKFQTDIDYNSSPLIIYLKNAKIDWNSSIGKITLGLQGMNIFNVVEKTWGFRFLEKSAMDKYGFSSSADMGIGYSGKFNNLHYNFMYTNGAGYKNSENNKYKKLSAQLVYGQKNLLKEDGINFGTSFSIEPYDYECEDNTITTKNKTLMAFYGGYAGHGLRIGAEFDMHTNDGTDITQQIMAGYVNYKLSDKINLLGRVDIYDPWTESIDNDDTPEIDEQKDNQINIIAGFNYHPAQGLTITPNIRISIPEEGDTSTLFMLNFEFKF